MKQWETSEYSRSIRSQKREEVVEASDASRLPPTQEMIDARKKCLHILEYAPRSQYMLEQKLSVCGFSQAIVEDAVAYAKSFGYVDDIQFAADYAAARCKRKSRSRLFQELAAKGISREIAASVLEACDSEEAAARYTAQKRIRSHPLQTREDVTKLIHYLVGKGFSYAVSKEAAQSFLTEE